ncbi:MAG: right-handed parallel beta-helix repeat-containing protein, partial [Candidatus Binatia bacterium]
MTRQPFLGILLAIVVCTAAQPIHAATITVTTTVDELNVDGDCSLREAVRAANTNVAVDACAAGQNDQTDTITVPAGTYTLTVVGNDNDGTGGDLDVLDNAVGDDLVISGAGAATTIIQACAVEQLAGDCPAGQGVVDRVLNVRDAHVAISGVTVRHGRAPVSNSVDGRIGSGIRIERVNTPGALTLTDVVVTKNGDAVGDISQGGGISNWYGVLTLTRVTVSDNVVAGNGGGISIRFNPATLVMTDSTVGGNTASQGGGIDNRDEGAATLTGCTISGNQASATGSNGAGGIVNTATATLTNCTVSGNQAKNGAGGIVNAGTMDLRSSTVTANRLLAPSQGAGGIYTVGSVAAGYTTVLRNTIVAGNFHDETTPSLNSPDCNSAGSETIVSEAFSLVGDAFHCPGLIDGVNGDQIGTRGAVIDAQLGPLADNGGPTLTHALLPGSLAIDGANPATPGSGGIACPTTDQRGESRPSGAACDVGSFEGGDGGAIAATAVKPTRGGTAGTVQMRVFGNGFVPGAVVRLVRAGFADVVATAANVRATAVTTSLDLRAVAPGVWSVEVENPDASVATLTDAFTVEAGGGSDLWVELLTPRNFQSGRVQSIYVLFGNRGTVDAYGVPLWLAFGEALRFFVPFAVSPPPMQPGQIPTDWTRIAIDLGRPPSPEIPEDTDTFHFLLPIVPAGSSGAFRVRVKSPFFLEPTDPGVPVSINVATDIGDPYFEPDLSAEVIAFYVSQAKQYAVAAHGTTTFPADAAIDAYVRTQLAAVVAEGRLAALGNESGNLPIYSQAQLIIDTGQFIAGESATASWTPGDRHWLARIVSEIVGGSAEARLADPCAGIIDVNEKIFCEEETDPCADGCPDDAPLIPPPFPCVGDTIEKILKFLGVPCKPKPKTVPFSIPHDPNEKVGPGGPGGFIDGMTPLSYSVTFENVKTATGDAFEVTVTDQLDMTKYDLDTFSLGSIAFADKFVPVPPGLKTFSTEVDLRPGVNILV